MYQQLGIKTGRNRGGSVWQGNSSFWRKAVSLLPPDNGKITKIMGYGLVVLLNVLVVCGQVQALSFMIDAGELVRTEKNYNIPLPNKWEEWDPLGNNKITSLASAYGEELTMHGIDRPGDLPDWAVIRSRVSGAAVYGSDSSANSAGYPFLDKTGVEPMAEAFAGASYFIDNEAIVSDGKTIGYQSYYQTGVTIESDAMIAVNHKIILDTTLASSSGMFEELSRFNSIPVKFGYNLHASHNAHGGFGSAAFRWYDYDDSLFAARRVFIPFDSNESSVELSGKLSTRLFLTTDIEEYIYTIEVEAHADGFSRNSSEGFGFAQAIADPFLYIDPDWQYAKYFKVEQESWDHPGEWVEVTRLWQEPADNSVPEPSSLLLLGAGLVWFARYGRKRSPQKSKR